MESGQGIESRDEDSAHRIDVDRWNPDKELKEPGYYFSDRLGRPTWNPDKELKVYNDGPPTRVLCPWNPDKELKGYRPCGRCCEDVYVESGQGIESYYVAVSWTAGGHGGKVESGQGIERQISL